MRRINFQRSGRPIRSAFERGPDERHLCVLLGPDLRDHDADELVKGFAHHRLVSSFSFDPSDGLPTIRVGDHDEDLDLIPYRVDETRSGAVMLASQWPGIARRLAQEGHGDADRLFESFILARIAVELGADALVTRDDFLLAEAPRGLVDDANPMTPEEAAAVTGLYLRLRGDFTVYKHQRGGHAYDRSLYYWVLGRSLLPSAWTWFSACVAQADAAGDEQLLSLGQSAIERVCRTLRARDRLLGQFQLRQTNDAADEALFQLDVALLMLSGAGDAIARVAHLVYGLAGSLQDSGWRRRAWLDRLSREDQRLAAYATSDEVKDVFDVIGLLRNTIHGEALAGFSYSDASSMRDPEHLIAIPKADEQRLLAALERQGGYEHWGVRDLESVHTGIEADTFIEALVPRAARVFDELMRQTSVDRLSGVDPNDLQAPSSTDSMFGARTARRLRLLSGLA